MIAESRGGTAVAKSQTFDSLFLGLTGNAPFPWQQALFDEFTRKQFRKTCDVPTGLGKTSIITIWLLALADQARAGTLGDFPRRLVYVVNRRTVVDQATREAERIRDALALNEEKALSDALRSLAAQSSDSPLAISTLRGQFADNAEWRNDPARPAVIVGTVDMIGSRLLFAGYGCGFKSRPLHAGFLGQDTLLVHDEAHLEPAFQRLLDAIELEQQRCRDFGHFRVMALTATPRSGKSDEAPIFSDKDLQHSEVKKRFKAKKGIAFHEIDDEKKTKDEVIDLALKHKDGGQAILIFLRELDRVKTVEERLRKEVGSDRVQTLTGTMRGFERDAMARNNDIFARFMPKHSPQVTLRQGSVFLVCTSAGEVGVDISADHMVCDLTPFDGMAQRFGRVNRFGTGDAKIDVVYVENNGNASGDSDKSPPPFEKARQRTLALLKKLQQRDDRRHDASPAALNDLPLAERLEAFTPQPTILFATDILFDAWSLTSVRERLPGRPPVADWLHGVAEWEPPETYVAWREEVEVLTSKLRERHKPDDLLEDFPLKPHELLRDRTKRIFDELKTLAETQPDLPVWIVGDNDVRTLKKVSEAGERFLENRTVLLPPVAGGLSKDGTLNGSASFDEARREDYDIADKWMDDKNNPRRCRVWDDDTPPNGMRLVRTIDTRPEADDEAENDEQKAAHRYWRWYVRPRSADDDGSRSARQPQELQPHLRSAESFAERIVDKLRLAETEASAVKLAARWHDLGKHRKIWQVSIGNRDYPRVVLAKSGGKMRPLDLNNYRHEFGSLIDVSDRREFLDLPPEVRDLVLHLIAAHHGRARPHFPADEAFDLEPKGKDADKIARAVPRRFARLQRKYGRWGLAYLESLVRAADALASQANDAREAEPSNVACLPQSEGQ